MSNADQFWELAQELWTAHSKTKKTRETLIERARTWAQAALLDEQWLVSAQAHIPRKPSDTMGSAE